MGNRRAHFLTRKKSPLSARQARYESIHFSFTNRFNFGRLKQ